MHGAWRWPGCLTRRRFGKRDKELTGVSSARTPCGGEARIVREPSLGVAFDPATAGNPCFPTAANQVFFMYI
jgi:hypothetical protein